MPGSLRPGAHGDARLLRDGLQRLTLHGLRDERQLLAQGLVAVAHADVRHIGAADVVALGALLGIVGSQPVALHLEGQGKVQGCRPLSGASRPVCVCVLVTWSCPTL